MQILTWITGIALAVVVIGLVTGMIPPPKNAFADSSKIVSLYYDGQKKVVTTGAPTVAAALTEAGVSIGAGDLVEPNPDTAIPNGFFNINVYRSRPVVVVDGTTRKIIQTALQSNRLIAEQAGLTVYPEDTYSIEVIND
ncbi:MAG TPA: ubiquitin-like domain-containing protein, partial [Candidatus Saccharimonadia bacterium]